MNFPNFIFPRFCRNFLVKIRSYQKLFAPFAGMLFDAVFIFEDIFKGPVSGIVGRIPLPTLESTGWPKIRYTIFWLFCIWSLKPISLKYLILFNALYQMKFNSMRYNFQNNFQREISQIAQLFGKLRDLRYLSRFFIYKRFLKYKKCQSSFYVWKLH